MTLLLHLIAAPAAPATPLDFGKLKGLLPGESEFPTTKAGLARAAGFASLARGDGAPKPTPKGLAAWLGRQKVDDLAGSVDCILWWNQVREEKRKTADARF